MNPFSAFASSIILLTATSLGLALQLNGEQQNWHQWRGPNSTGFIAGAKPPTQWSEQKNVQWKVPIPGEGSSTPIVWNDQVFLATAVVTERQPNTPPKLNEPSMTVPPKTIVEFKVICLDRATGKILWDKTVTEAAPHEGRHKSTTYAAASPVTNGKHVFVSFGSYGVFCLTMDGEPVWSAQLGKMRTRRGWGEGVSPTLAGNQLIVMWDQEDQSKIFALDASDGTIAWEQERDEPTTWATPLVVTRKGQSQIVTPGTNKVRSYDLGSGKLVWESTGLTLNAIPCPVPFENSVICMSGYRGNAAVSIDLDSVASTSNNQSPTVNWKLESDTPYVPSPLLTGNRLYFTKGLSAIVTCVDANTGKAFYPTRRLDGLKNLYASPVASERHVYFVSREGVTLVIENSDEFKIVATNQLDGQIDASPAMVGDQMFLRSKSHLYCLRNEEVDH